MKGTFKNKVFLHMLIMLNIAVIVICIQNKDFIFSERFLENISKYNLNLKMVYIIAYIPSIKPVRGRADQ